MRGCLVGFSFSPSALSSDDAREPLQVADDSLDFQPGQEQRLTVVMIAWQNIEIAVEKEEMIINLSPVSQENERSKIDIFRQNPVLDRTDNS